MYRSIEQDQFDYEHTIEFAAEEAAKEGRKQGMQQGIQEGRREGRREGRQEGRQEGTASTTRAIVWSLLNKTDFDDLTIADLTCTDEQFVKSVRQELTS